MDAKYNTQPAIEPAYVAKQPMSAKVPSAEQSKQEQDPLRLRGGCPGRLCGLPILPCRCDICIIPIPCC